MFTSIIDSSQSTITVSSALICTLVSIVLGIAVAAVYSLSTRQHTKNLIITLAVLPVLVQDVIMMVSGNLGTSVAVLGTFSLVRFRSTPGTSKEIMAIFLSMTIGLATGMGQVVFAALIAVIVSLFILILNKSRFGERKDSERILKITVPENIDYGNVFDDIFAEYTERNELESVKTTNMGSLYELKYSVRLKKDADEKKLIDALRCRNANLNIILTRPKPSVEEL